MTQKSQIPFDVTLPDESFCLGSLTIPKYGSLTPREIIALGEIEAELKSLSEYHAAIVSVLIGSRCGEVGDFDLMDLPSHLLRSAYDFVMNEFREWKSEPVEQGDAKKQPTGEPSIGDCEPDIPMTSASVSPDLAIVQSG